MFLDEAKIAQIDFQPPETYEYNLERCIHHFQEDSIEIQAINSQTTTLRFKSK